MKRHANCKNSNIDDTEFCKICDQNFQEPKTYTQRKAKANNKFIKVCKILILILLWFFFSPIMLIITIIRLPKLAKPIKAILVCLVVAFVTAIGFSSTEDVSYDQSYHNSAPSNSDTINNSEDPPTNSLFSTIITEQTLRKNFLDACEQIGMEYEQIKDLKQVDDWAGGPRYSFTYQNMPFRLYCNMDSTIKSIKLGADIDVYKQGFEAYQVKDYIIDSNIAAELQEISKEHIKNQLNYPSSADFAWLDWTYGRDHDIYSISSSVTAKNAFGVKDDLPFTLTYQINGDSIKLVYFEIKGNIISNKMDTISIPERKRITDEIYSTSDTIILIDGELGSYGKTVDIDGHSMINYYVPEGTYTVLNNGKLCKVYLAKDEYYKNSDGYAENEIVETLEFSKYGESKTITIKKGEHIELTINANVILTPIN